MKNVMKYFKKPHRMLTLFSYIFSGFGTLCIVIFSGFPDWVKITTVILYGILVLLAIISTIKWTQAGLTDLIPPNPMPENQSPESKIIEPDQIIEKGIEKVHLNMVGDYTELTNHFKTARHSIKIITYYGDNLLKGAKGEIIEAMNRNVDIQMLIAGKESILLDEVWELEGERQPHRLDATREIIEKIKATSENEFRFKYKEYNTQVRYAVVIVDGQWAWWTPYHPGINVEKTTTLVLTNNSKTSIIWDCINHFDRLWDKLPVTQ